MTSRSRNWLFTVNHVTEDTVEVLKILASDKRCRYMVIGFERAPTTNHEHLQGFIIFTYARNFNSVKKFSGVVIILTYGLEMNDQS